MFQAPPGVAEDLKAVDQLQATAADEMQARFDNIRVKVKAGERRVGVAFIQRSFAESDSTLRPVAMRCRRWSAPRAFRVSTSRPVQRDRAGRY